MNSLHNLIVAFAAAFFLTSIGLAADPSGEWKWAMGGRGGGGGGGGQGTPAEVVLTLAVKDGQLSGKLSGGRGDPVAISAASIKGDTVEFTVSRQGPNGANWTSKYVGKISGDTITGTIEGPGRGGEVMKREWVAKRSK